jgi:hypothetical protein
MGEPRSDSSSSINSSESSDSTESLGDIIHSKDEVSEELSIDSPSYLKEHTSNQILERLKKEIRQLI